MIFVSNKTVCFLIKEELEDFSTLSKDTRDGEQLWLDEKGLAHREDGPANVQAGGYENWFKHGSLHREDGPAIIGPKYKGWLINGRYHREDGPAYTDSSGYKLWYLNGLQTSEEAVRALGKMK